MESADRIERLLAEPRFLLGHQGGWDEILMVVGPLLVVGLLLWLANKRVSAQLEAAEESDGRAASQTERPSR
ncbi:MAG: hypothetical protein AAF531_21915 [Actinomycetota bacterium]